MSALIARLEAGPVYLTHKEAYDLAIFFGSDTALGMASVIRKAFAGGSLDAALALAERVLPGWIVSLDGLQEGRWYGAVSAPTRGPRTAGGHYYARAPTPALALCIAVLKAVQHAKPIPNGYEAAGEVSPNLKAKAQGEGG